MIEVESLFDKSKKYFFLNKNFKKLITKDDIFKKSVFFFQKSLNLFDITIVHIYNVI